MTDFIMAVKIVRKLMTVWELFPEWSFGRLLYNVSSVAGTPDRLYYIKDEDFILGMDALIEARSDKLKSR